MIDIKAIRENPERFKAAASNKRVNCDIDAICALDDRRRALQTEMDQVKHRQNELSDQIAKYRIREGTLEASAISIRCLSSSPTSSTTSGSR